MKLSLMSLDFLELLPLPHDLVPFLWFRLCPKFLNQLVHMNFYCINGSFNTLLNDVDCYLLLRVLPMQLPKLKHYYSLWYIAPTTAKTTMAST